MLKKPLKNVQHELTEKNFEDLATQIEGYSGSDIKTLIKDAVYQPMRIFQKADRFKKLSNGKWKPCKEGQQGGEAKTWLDFEDENDVEIDSISMIHFQEALKRTKASVDQQQLKKYEEWTEAFGQEGI